LKKFYIPTSLWLDKIDFFFTRNNLPKDPNEAIIYLSNLLVNTISKFNKEFGKEGVSEIISSKLHPPKDPAELLSNQLKSDLDALKSGISVRKIAKELKMSTRTVWKYGKQTETEILNP
jgi:DNA-binding NarL/FixJ family response regulator